MRERLQQLENNVAELKKLKIKYQMKDIQKETTKEWALRYGLLESIQIMIDIACHLTVHHNLGNADTYAECIELLHKFDYISHTLKEDLIKMAGLRNILVHEYVAVEVSRLYDLLNKLDDFKTFVAAVEKHFIE